MDFASRYGRLFQHLQIHWPKYILGYGAPILFSIAIFVLSIIQRWLSFTLIGLAASTISIYFLAASLWSVHQIYDLRGIDQLVRSMTTFEPKGTIVDINLGDNSFAVGISHDLTTGRVLAFDVYNPQLTSGKHLGRLRRLEAKPPPDPRLSWRQTDLKPLPLPNKSVAVVSLVEVLSEFWQEGDRHLLLTEIFRILQPGGVLIMVERMRCGTNLLVVGLELLRLKAPSYWSRLLSEANFNNFQSASYRDLITCCLVTIPQDEIAG